MAVDTSKKRSQSDNPSDDGTAAALALEKRDPGIRPQQEKLAILVGLLMVSGGIAVLALLNQEVHKHLGILMACVGFGLVLAAFGARAGGIVAGVAIVGVAALVIVLFLLLESYVPDAPPAYIKKGIISGVDKVAVLKIFDDDPQYTYRDTDANGIRFVLLRPQFKQQHLIILIDTTDTGSADAENIELSCDTQDLQAYMDKQDQIIQWRLQYSERKILDEKGNAICSPRDALDNLPESSPQSDSFLSFVSPAYAQDAAPGGFPQDFGPKEIARALASEDTAIRRLARERISRLPVNTIPALVQLYRENSKSYRITLGILVGLNGMLREQPKNKSGELSASIPKQFKQDDLQLLLRSVYSPDRTMRINGAEVLYYLKDPRLLKPSLDAIKASSLEDGTYNNLIVLMGFFWKLDKQEQDRTYQFLRDELSQGSSKTRKLIECIYKQRSTSDNNTIRACAKVSA